jgi:hypothetical protein
MQLFCWDLAIKKILWLIPKLLWKMQKKFSKE